jgi:general secretion pathway protein M
VSRFRELRGWPSRIAALAVLALLLGLLHAGLIAPYLDYAGALDERVAIKSALLDRMRAMSDAPQPAAESAAAPDALLARLLLPDISDAQAIAQMQDRLKHLAADHGIELQNIQVLPRAETSSLARLGVRLRGSADMAALERFLHAVEGAEPTLLIDNLRIQSRLARGTAPPPPGTAAPLDIQLDAIGFKAGTS